MSNVNMQAFINKYGNAATQAATGSKVFAETILTAAALESGYGKSQLAAKCNNFFGVKADSSWKGKFVTMPTKEQDGAGNVFTVNAKFRHYDTAQESFTNYVKFITGPRYVKAGVTTAATPEEQFVKIKAAGYATDVNYSNKLTAIYRTVTSWVSNNAGTGLAGIATVAILFFLISKTSK